MKYILLCLTFLTAPVAFAQVQENENTQQSQIITDDADSQDDLSKTPDIENTMKDVMVGVRELATIAGVMKECKPEYYTRIEACALYNLDHGMEKITDLKIKKNISDKFKQLWDATTLASFNKQVSIMPPMSCEQAIETFSSIPIIQKCHIEQKYIDVIGEDETDHNNGEIIIKQ